MARVKPISLKRYRYFLPAAGCAGGGNNEIQESPCDWRDGRPGCEEEKVHCADPRNCY